MMKVTCWASTGYRKQSQAYFYAVRIVSQTEKSIRFQLPDGEQETVKHNDLISIEDESGRENN